MRRSSAAVKRTRPRHAAPARRRAGSGPVFHARLRNVLAATTAVCGIAGLSACSPPLPAPPPPSPASDAGSAADPAPYRIQAGDVLAIRLLLNPDLNEDVVVRPDGHMSTTVVSDELARGRTVPELITALTHDYTSIIRKPRLTVVLKTFTPIRIYVGGEVVKPGESVSAGVTPTLSQAIARAGGPRSGDEDRVFVIRRGDNDVPQFFSVRLRDVTRTHDPKVDVQVAPYDVLYVPRDGIAEVRRFLSENFQQLVPAMWGFSYNLDTGPATETPVP